LGEAVGDAGAVVVGAGQLLMRHCPMDTLSYLLGAAAHNGLLWFCVWLSEKHSTTAAFVLPLVPMATLTALVLALRELTPSLRHIRPPAMTRLTLLASTLIPFLTVYVSQQYLKEDTRAFLNAATSDELLERSGGLGPSTSTSPAQRSSSHPVSCRVRTQLSMSPVKLDRRLARIQTQSTST
jgi:hypothetical protein